MGRLQTVEVAACAVERIANAVAAVAAVAGEASGEAAVAASASHGSEKRLLAAVASASAWAGDVPGLLSKGLAKVDAEASSAVRAMPKGLGEEAGVTVAAAAGIS